MRCTFVVFIIVLQTRGSRDRFYKTELHKYQRMLRILKTFDVVTHHSTNAILLMFSKFLQIGLDASGRPRGRPATLKPFDKVNVHTFVNRLLLKALRAVRGASVLDFVWGSSCALFVVLV